MRSIMSTINSSQAGGSDFNGLTGTDLFAGSGAGNMALASSMTSGSQIATAATGSVANSPDATQLTALQTAFSVNDFAGQTNQMLFTASSAVSGATTTRDALDAITTNAKTALSTNSGVDLNTEAANLVRYQQAFQASGKIIQVASTLFNQLLQI
jgi:flagellar hook-associated protein 1